MFRNQHESPRDKTGTHFDSRKDNHRLDFDYGRIVWRRGSGRWLSQHQQPHQFGLPLGAIAARRESEKLLLKLSVFGLKRRTGLNGRTRLLPNIALKITSSSK
jgi:hypothetical protein